MDLLLLSLAPGLVIALYVYIRDKYEREPFKTVAITFAFGAFGAIVAALLESAFPDPGKHAGLLASAANATLVVAPIEEIVKFLAVWLLVFRAPAFNEPFDGVVYCVMASMGFATLENLLYVVDGGMRIGIERAFISVPGHAAYAAIMGCFMGQARFARGGKRRLLLLQGLAYAIIAHGLFDFGLMSRTGWGLICTGVTFLAAITCAFLAIRASGKASGLFWAARRPVTAEEGNAG